MNYTLLLGIHRNIKKDKNLGRAVEKTLSFLIKNPFHPSLRIHKIVMKNTSDVFSISVNMKIRIFIHWEENNPKKITLLKIGDHQLYQ